MLTDNALRRLEGVWLAAVVHTLALPSSALAGNVETGEHFLFARYEVPC